MIVFYNFKKNCGIITVFIWLHIVISVSVHAYLSLDNSTISSHLIKLSTKQRSLGLFPGSGARVFPTEDLFNCTDAPSVFVFQMFCPSSVLCCNKK